MVRPWKAPSRARILVRLAPLPPVLRRASLKAASLASVPELVKNTLDPAGASVMASSFSASAIWVGLVKKLETWPRVASWLDITDVTNGLAWPSALTAMPPSRSRYSLPSASQTRQPAPRTRTRCGVPNTPMRELEYRASHSAPLPVPVITEALASFSTAGLRSTASFMNSSPRRELPGCRCPRW
jgi:hypothetical protein